VSEDQKRKRSQAVRESLLKGAEKLGGEDDYGRGLANFYRSCKLTNGQHPVRSKSIYFSVTAILCVLLVIIFFLLRLRDRDTQKKFLEVYIPIETTDSQQQSAEPALGSRQDAYNHIVFLIRSLKYQEALSVIDEALEKGSLFPDAETELLSLYKMIILYETGAAAKARALATSIRPTASQEMRKRLDFYAGLIQQ
jgi:hypothetical protein